MVAGAITVAALLALLVALLAVPLVVVVDVERNETWRARWRVSWLFGLLDMRSAGGRRTGSPAPEPVERSTRVSTKRRTRGARVGLALVRTRGFAGRVARLTTALFRRVHLDRLHVDAAFGFENPADTGVVYGCLSPLLVLAGTRGLDVRCTPMFWERGVKGSLGATIRVRPLSIAGTAAAFLASPPVARAMVAAWRARA